MPHKNLIIFCNRKSVGGRVLAEEVNAHYWGMQPRDKPEHLAVLRNNPLFINWGCGDGPYWLPDRRTPRLLNHWEGVWNGIRKLHTYKMLQRAGVPTLEATEDHRAAAKWIRDGYKVFGRQDQMQMGKGIHVFDQNNWEKDANAPVDFYAKYYDKTHEFRVHVFRGTVLDVTQKKRLNGVQDAGLVRSWDNGWIFAHHNQICTEEHKQRMGESAIAALRTIGLDFGAVDMLATYHGERLMDHRVCEVNSAPGRENNVRAFDAYIAAINHWYEEVA